MKKKFFIFILLLSLFSLNACGEPTIEKDPKMLGVLNEVTYFEGEMYDPLDGITAFDKEGNDVTKYIKVIGYLPIINGRLTDVGAFTYELCVIIDDKEIISQQVTLTVKENPSLIVDQEKPIINANNTYVFEIGSEINLNISASDNVDGNITKYIEIQGLNNLKLDSENKFTEIGTYYITCTVSDTSGNKTSKTICIIVKEENKYSEITREEIVSEEYQDIDTLVVMDNYKLVWAEEFNYTGAPNANLWSYEIGNGSWGWGNGESQYYTSNSKNVYVENGKLKITAIKESINGFNYSSSRIRTINKADFKYGYFEASIMMASAGGAWPAFWMMPTKSVYGTWPASGEIDIVEYVANNHNKYMGTVHNSKYNGGNAKSSGYKSGSNLETEFHKYAIEWTPNFIKFYYDGLLYYTYNNPNRFTDNQIEWPYDQDFYILLNLAVGGSLGGTIASDFTKTSMLVDYVRVYQSDYTKSDTIAPEQVEASYSSTSDSILLKWDKVTDNVGLHHYEIIVNGKQYAATNNLAYTLNGLESNTAYYIQVLAVDLAGNYSSTGELKINTKE